MCICEQGITPVRCWVGLMIFITCVIWYTTEIGVVLDTFEIKINSREVCPSKDDGNISSYKRQTCRNRLHQIRESFYWGCAITSIPGGVLAENFGPALVIFISTSFSGVLTVLIPTLTNWDYRAVITARFMTGLCAGMLFPSLHCLISRWAAPEEKGKFVALLLGKDFGRIFMGAMLRHVKVKLSWSWVFYVIGIIVVIYCFLWKVCLSDAPHNHRKIGNKERIYIKNSLGDNVTYTNKKELPPYINIALSIPFWAFVILHIGSEWGLYVAMNVNIKLQSLGDARQYYHGLNATCIYVCRLVPGILLGVVGDCARSQKIISNKATRKGFVLLSHLAPGILLLLGVCIIVTLEFQLSWGIAFLALWFVLTSASVLTNYQNVQDLAPNYAATLYGIADSIAITAKIIAHTIVREIFYKYSKLQETTNIMWYVILGGGGILYIMSGFIFLLLGHTDVQKWNQVRSTDDVENQNTVNA